MPNEHGQNLINLCRSTNLRILNGRKLGDTIGNFTCFTHNGASTVDYALSSQSLFDKINLFHVSEQMQISDHCKITIEIPNAKYVEPQNCPYQWKQIKDKYIWDEESKDNFKAALISEDIKTKLAELSYQIENNVNINTIGENLTSLFTTAASKSLKTKKTKVNLKKTEKRHKKWFDQECKDNKSKLHLIAKWKHKNPHNEHLRIAYREKMKEYKKLCKQKRNFFWDTQITKIQENFNKQNFWNVWKEFDERITEESIAIKDGKKWELHYRSLFLAPPSSANKFDNDNIQNSTFHTQLNEPITNSEIMKSVNQLKTNKSAGIDRISNEMIKHATPDVIATIKNIFNIFLDKATIPQSWCQGLITPIYKKGNKMDPGNYRGICVANAMLKLLCIILNNRLTNYSVDKNIIHPNQIGFQRNCRTTDHIFTLKTLINKHVQDKSKQKVHAAFIDFAKAFDTVWHHGLFFKLRSKGINGNFLQLIQSIYNSTECAVKIGSKHTKFFKCSRGVRQGCPLSPTLFNIYINDLIDNLEKINPTPLTLQDKKISCLMYADDIIILSSSHKGLQDCLDTLASFCNNWKLSINKSKSKCMTFYKRKCKYNRNFFIDDTPLENVTEYTYLGLTVDAKCSFKETLEMLSCKAHRAIYALNSRYQLKHLPIQAALKLFDSTIVPILLYGSEVWSIYENVDDKEWDSNRIEKIHTQFLKRILGVNRSTTNIMVRGELGRYPLRIQTDSRTINFAKHISEECKPSALVHYSMEYEKSITNRKTIISYINDLSDKLTKNEVSKKLITEHSKSNIKKILEANYQLSWKSRMKNCSKALTYGSYKNRINLEAYLSLITNRADRRIMSKLRLSDHCLTIERGRHCKPPIERDKRFCLSCKDKIEDETHFILECDMFKEERVTFLHYTKDIYPNFETIPTLEQKLIFLQTNENCHFLETFTRYLNAIYKLRSQNETQKIDDA